MLGPATGGMPNFIGSRADVVPSMRRVTSAFTQVCIMAKNDHNNDASGVFDVNAIEAGDDGVPCVPQDMDWINPIIAASCSSPPPPIDTGFWMKRKGRGGSSRMPLRAQENLSDVSRKSGGKRDGKLAPLAASISALSTETTWNCDDPVDLTKEDHELLLSSPNRKPTKNIFGNEVILEDQDGGEHVGVPDLGRRKRNRTCGHRLSASSCRGQLGELTNTVGVSTAVDENFRIWRSNSDPPMKSRPAASSIKKCDLPTVENRLVGQAGSYVSTSTVVDVMKGEYDMDFEIIDCRYPYEYEAGHIKGAINLYTQHQIRDYFLDDRGRFRVSGSKFYIFHCEFSQERGPKMFGTLRNIDRAIGNTTNPGMQNFPLELPNMYVLWKGYRAFIKDFPTLCLGGYKMMKDNVELLKHYKSKVTESERFFDPKKPINKMMRHNSWSFSPTTLSHRGITERTNSSPAFTMGRGKPLFADDIEASTPTPLKIRRKRSFSVLVE